LSEIGRKSLQRKILVFSAFFLVLSFFLDAQPASKKFVKIYFSDGDSVMAELAVTPEERARGLMYRKKMGSDQGMLFIFSEEGFYSFWMKNMVIPLDFIWLDKERRIVHIEQNVPPCKQEPCPTYTSKVPAKFFLELKAGSVEKRNLKTLDRLDFVLPHNEGHVPNYPIRYMSQLISFKVGRGGLACG
jgi:hypothetical protein